MVVIVLVALLGLLFSVGSNSSSGSAIAVPGGGPPTALFVESTTPLVVRGSGFRPGEHVTVTAYTATRPQAVSVKAIKGSFRVNLRVSNSKCGGAHLVRARGDKGSVATIGLESGICIPPPRRP